VLVAEACRKPRERPVRDVNRSSHTSSDVRSSAAIRAAAAAESARLSSAAGRKEEDVTVETELEGEIVVELVMVLQSETLDVRSRAMHTRMRLLESKVCAASVLFDVCVTYHSSSV
jgi:hypothetical protein